LVALGGPFCEERAGVIVALHVYLDEACTQQVSEGTDLAPWSETYNGTDGQVVERKLYLRNDNNPAGKTFEDATVTSQGTTAANAMQFALDNAGLAGVYGASISLPNGTFLVAVPFWVRCTVPAGTTDQNITGADIKVDGKRFAV
jgi:hypothetical protein